MNYYTCKICKRKHSIYYGLDIPEPESIGEISEEERELRVQFFEDKYVIDRKNLLIKGEIEIVLDKSKDQALILRVWTSIDIEEFEKLINGFESDSVLEIKGEIDNELPLYDDLRGIKVIVIFDPSKEYPKIQIETESQIKEDQVELISEDRMLELMNRFHHPELSRERIKFAKDFAERFTETLEEVERQFFRRRKQFVITLSSPRTLLFQIVASEMLVNPIGKGTGYGLHIAFDDTDIETKEELEKFEGSEYADEFDCVEIDDIVTYQKDFKKDKEELKQMVTDLITKFHEEEIEEIEVDFFGL